MSAHSTGYSRHALVRKSTPYKKPNYGRISGVQKAHHLYGDALLEKLGLETTDDLRIKRLKQEIEKNAELAKLNKKRREPQMTVSLYKSTANGTNEIVVQTNAQSLDVFIAGLSSALHDALVKDALGNQGVDNSETIIASTLKNAFPVAFAISGYKADKVSESKLLTCGFASPDASELLAQSAV